MGDTSTSHEPTKATLFHRTNPTQPKPQHTISRALPADRHFFSWIGCRPASPKNIKKIFDEGCDCAITVGGVAGAWIGLGDAGAACWRVRGRMSRAAPSLRLTRFTRFTWTEMFMVGGEEEKVYLKKHKGFVREAIKVRGWGCGCGCCCLGGCWGGVEVVGWLVGGFTFGGCSV